MAEKQGVDAWDYSKYPDKHPMTGEPVSNVWKLSVLDPHGRMQFKYVKEKVKVQDEETGELVTKEVQTPMGSRFALVTSLDARPRGADADEEAGQVMTDKIMPEDIRNAELKIEGRPTVVQMGVWGKFVDGKWVMQDKRKSNFPENWRNVTEKYKVWRKKAYELQDDPYKDQPWPQTMVQTMEEQLEAEKKEKERLQAVNAELADKLAEAKGIKTGGTP